MGLLFGVEIQWFWSSASVLILVLPEEDVVLLVVGVVVVACAFLSSLCEVSRLVLCLVLFVVYFPVFLVAVLQWGRFR